MNTVDEILARFEGLTVRREIPCSCHWERNAAEACPRYYRYEDLIRRMENKRLTVECPDTFTAVSVPLLLYGIHSSTNEQVMKDIQEGQAEIKREVQSSRQEMQGYFQSLELRLNQQSELIVRSFTRQWNLEMQKLEAECPNTFVLESAGNSMFNPKNWVSEEYHMYLICQHPSGPHRVGKGYHVRRSEEWWKAVSPWLNHLVTFLKYGIPLGQAIGLVYAAVDVKSMQDTIGMVNQIVSDVPELEAPDGVRAVSGHLAGGQHVAGAALRALYNLLKEVDPDQTWGGLRKTVTPDGNIFWLCEEHRQQYEVKPLVLP